MVNRNPISNRRLRRLRASIVALALVTAALAPAARGDAGELDSSFGSRGRTITPLGFKAPWSQVPVQLAATPDGGSVTAAEAQLLRYLPDGQLDPAFGAGGWLTVTLPGPRRFEVGDLAVDAQGRVVVVGSAVGAQTAARRPAPSLAAVLRYLPDGTLDPSFGGGDGLLTTDFGLGTSVTASLAELDPEGWLTLVAGNVQPVSSCGAAPRLLRHDRLVARLAPDGSLDQTFGDRGRQGIDPLQTVESIAFDRDGGLVLAGRVASRCGHGPHLGLIRLRAGGARVRSFGKDGTRRLTGVPAAIAVDQSNRVVLLCKSKQTRVRDERSTKIARLLPSGALDPAFSNGWIVYTAKGPLYRWSDLVIDSQQRPLLIGTLIKQPHEGFSKVFHRWMMVMPLRQDGMQRSDFTFRGWLAISRFDASSDASASEALIDRSGGLLVAGTARDPRQAPPSALALARFQLESTQLPEVVGLPRSGG